MGSGKQVDIYLPKEKGYPEITGIFYIENGLIFVDDKLKNEKRKLEPNNVIDLEIMKIKVNAIS